MKRLWPLLAIASLILTACPKQDDYGCDKPGKPRCPTLQPIPSSASPSATTPGASVAPSIVPTTLPPKPSCATYKGRTYTIVIRDVFKMYQPPNLNLYRGDYILFKNEDPRNLHSLTVDGTDLDTGILKPGEQKRLRVLLPPKYYPRWHDRQVSYVHGGPLNVTKNARCP